METPASYNVGQDPRASRIDLLVWRFMSQLHGSGFQPHEVLASLSRYYQRTGDAATAQALTDAARVILERQVDNIP